MGQVERGETFLPSPWGHQAPREQPRWEKARGEALQHVAFQAFSSPSPSPRSLSQSWGSALGWRSQGSQFLAEEGSSPQGFSPRPSSSHRRQPHGWVPACQVIPQQIKEQCVSSPPMLFSKGK